MQVTTDGLYYCGKLLGRNLDNTSVYCGQREAQCDDCERYQQQNGIRQVDPMQALMTLLGNTSISQRQSDTGGQGRYLCNCCRMGINGLRYNCEICDDFDLCEVCFSGKQVAEDHVTGHRMTPYNGTTPIGFLCDSCGISINGLRWRCTVCPSFDICGSCHNRSKWPAHHLTTHHEVTYQDFAKDAKTMVVDMSFTCDVCHSEIVGLRIHCNNCPNFDICKKCHDRNKKVPPHSSKHTVSAFREPGSILAPEYCTSQRVSSTIGVAPTVKLVSVSSLSSLYGSTKDLFFKSWTKDVHLKSKMTIRAVCRVDNNVLKSSYRIYKTKLQKEKVNPNKMKLWHGTALQCDLYRNKFSTCHSPKCAVCNIVENNFILSRAQSNIGFARFGNGMYFSPCSSKSHDYNGNSEKSGIRAMILCQVILGKSYITRENMTDLLAPPSGYHSVYGEPGGALNYPEVVIWSEQAIVPIAVVFYSI